MPGDGGKIKIVVVDDDPSITRIISIILKAHGYDVVTASGGETGLELVYSEKPDVMLLDIMMPDIDGFEVCRRLKEDEATSAVPIIFVSARGDASDIEKGLSMGACAYITKPFAPELLLARIAETSAALRKAC